VKGKLVELEKKKASLENELSSVGKQIEDMRRSVATKWTGESRLCRKVRAGKPRRRRVAQPPVSALVTEILKEKRKPLGVNQISDSLLNEKKYKTYSKNFKGQLRVLLYKNEKGLFKRTGSGLFALA
jgi:hypothetical protein